MPRCPDCNKFASYDDSYEPEVNSLSIETDGQLLGEVRVVLPCAECGTELREANFEINDTVDEVEAHCNEHHCNKDGVVGDVDLSVEEESVEMTTRSEGKGRGTRTFYGFTMTVKVTCETCKEKMEWTHEVSDDMQASSMDDLT